MGAVARAIAQRLRDPAPTEQGGLSSPGGRAAIGWRLSRGFPSSPTVARPGPSKQNTASRVSYRNRQVPDLQD